MDYKSLMGYSKKKKVTKKESKPKVNEVLESIKEEFGLVKEVGASTEYKKITKKIEKSYRQYLDDVDDLGKILLKKGLKNQARLIHKEYMKKVLGFQAWLRGQIDRLL